MRPAKKSDSPVIFPYASYRDVYRCDEYFSTKRCTLRSRNKRRRSLVCFLYVTHENSAGLQVPSPSLFSLSLSLSLSLRCNLHFMLVGKKSVQHTFLWFFSVSPDTYMDSDLKQTTTTVVPTDQHNYSFIIIIIIIIRPSIGKGPGYLSRYSDLLWSGRSGGRILVGARFSAPLQTGPGAHPASYTMGTGSFPGIKRPGRGVDHPPHLVPRLKKE